MRTSPARRHRLVPVLALLCAACGEAPPPVQPPLDPAALLGGGADAGFLRATALREFDFPEDHGPHPGFRNEWWYLTGNLESEGGRRFGYQVTFFRMALSPEDEALPPESAWDGNEIWMAHAALTDVAGGRHLALERFSRENPGLAGATAEPFRVWLENWRLASLDGAFPWRLELADEPFALDLQVSPQKPPVPQGEEGLSRKSAEPGNASHYYSFTRLATEGEIRLGEDRYRVRGESWLDREWSTSALAADQSGWDWFSLQFSDGTELMYYRLRGLAGESHPYSLGNFTDAQAMQHLIRPADIRLEELEHWRSPAGVEYATQWRLTYEGRALRVRALLEEQWMDLSVRYWEGAVEVIDEESGGQVGRGYLEMVR